MLRMYSRKPPGRPKLHKADPNISHMRVTAELKALIEAEIKGRETMAECCLRLIRDKVKDLNVERKKVSALERALEESDIQYTKMMEKRFGKETISI